MPSTFRHIKSLLILSSCGQISTLHHNPRWPRSCRNIHTSLHIINRTFEDRRAIRSILHGFCVNLEERDATIDIRLIGELRRIKWIKDIRKLPFVFNDGKYVGGADEIKQLFENGELNKLITTLPKVQLKENDLCEGLKFMVCSHCDGKHKIYMIDDGFVRCGASNVNGLVPCPFALLNF